MQCNAVTMYLKSEVLTVGQQHAKEEGQEYRQKASTKWTNLIPLVCLWSLISADVIASPVDCLLLST